MSLHHTLHHIDNGEGWRLALHQTWGAKSSKKPVLIVPGYGMNSFIFSYHPTGASLEKFLVQRGFEVWRVDLRTGGQYAMEDLALTDLGKALEGVRTRTHTGHDKVDVIGASLGGTLMFAHAALNPAHHMATLVSMGAPVRWVYVHPVVRTLFRSPWLVGQVRIRGARQISRVLLPQLARFLPWVLSIYMNPEITDTSAAAELVRTIEDPNRHINRQIAQWVRERDLVLNGINLSEAIANVTQPYMCILANNDGIVPRETAIYPYGTVRSADRALVEVGSREMQVAHADLFISKLVHAHVFAPIADWLDKHGNMRPRA